MLVKLILNSDDSYFMHYGFLRIWYDKTDSHGVDSIFKVNYNSRVEFYYQPPRSWDGRSRHITYRFYAGV